MTFEEVRTEYEQRREQERIGLANYLAAHEGLRTAGLRVITGGSAGKGSEHYTSHGRISTYDLRNWKWVEVEGTGEFDAVISLNILDIDSKTKNIHSLYDRIGVILSPEEWVYTSIDLPLSEAEKEQIAQLVLEQYKKYKQHKEN